MVEINKIKRIRYCNTPDGVWYGFTNSLFADEKNLNSGIVIPKTGRYNRSVLNDTGREILDKLIQSKFVSDLTAGAFWVMIELKQGFCMQDVHDEVVTLLNASLLRDRLTSPPMAAACPWMMG